MDRTSAMLMLLGILVTLLLISLALFTKAPIFTSCLFSLLYTLYLFISIENHGIYFPQEYENQFWTIFSFLFSTVSFFAKDSPIAFGQCYPFMGIMGILAVAYGIHTWDRHMHRIVLSKKISLRRAAAPGQLTVRINDPGKGTTVQEHLIKINICLTAIDQLLIPSAINNFINLGFVLRNEREIINIFQEADKNTLNYLVRHTKLSLLFYKIKDHRNFGARHRTMLIELLAVDKLSMMTVVSRVVVLHALQMTKLPVVSKAEYWVRNIIVNTRQDQLSELKTRTDSKGNFFCMNKLIYEYIRSETVRQDILRHISGQANVQKAHMKHGTRHSKTRRKMAWRKILSDVDDTLTCSGGSYPSGIDKRYGKNVVYPGVLAFYRELDLGADGLEEWPDNTVGNLVFLSARPHVYKDMSERRNFHKFDRLINEAGADGRGGMHAVPTLLAGDLSSGTEFMMTNNYEPLARKKFENFQNYVSIYPEFSHIFICDNGQGDVRAAEMMFKHSPEKIEALYVHKVQSMSRTYKYSPGRWKGISPCFFSTYPEAALHAVTRKLPLIRVSGLLRICQDTVNDFNKIPIKDWPSRKHFWDSRDELNQALWRCNEYLKMYGKKSTPLIETERLWRDGEKISTPYGKGTVLSFDKDFDLYEVVLDWRYLNMQIEDHKISTAFDEKKSDEIVSKNIAPTEGHVTILETVEEAKKDIENKIMESPLIVGCGLSDTEVDGFWSLVKNGDKGFGDDAPFICNIFARSCLSNERIKSAMHKSDVDKNNILSNSKRMYMEFHSKQADSNKKISHFRRNSYFRVIAKIQGHLITKFTLPLLPSFSEQERSGFSLWNSRNDRFVISTARKHPFSYGDKVCTPFGPGCVSQYKEMDKIITIEMIGWCARAYIRQNDVKIMEGEGRFKSLLKIISPSDKLSPSRVVRSKGSKQTHLANDIVETPFGFGTLSYTQLIEREKRRSVTASDGLLEFKCKENENVLSSKGVKTIGICLISWTLANGSHPTLYCTMSAVSHWKKAIEGKHRSKHSPGILSVFGSIVSTSMRLITGHHGKKEMLADILVSRFERYYKDGASVTTTYGDGYVQSFREYDGFYEVYIVNWKMTGNAVPVAFLKKDSLKYYMANGCHVGYPVLTSYGLTGNLACVEPTTGVHIVAIPLTVMVCYFQPKDILKPLKVAVGENVLTPYGKGNLLAYKMENNIYEIALSFGAMLYAKEDIFERLQDGIEDHDSLFKMKSILQYLFFSPTNNGIGFCQRSRNNSITSTSLWNQSSRNTI